jgi:pyrimidine oxygenase
MALELGVFIPVGNNGWIISKNSPQYLPTFELNKQISVLAERVGFDYVFSMAKWRGFGGETRFWDYSLESVMLMAALAPLTSEIRLISSIAPSLTHPAVYAKMAATLDDICQGRLTVNIVSAANRDEYAQMGLYPDNFESFRYPYTQEWLEVCKRLWTEDSVTFHGKYFTLDDCQSWPKPVQRPHPPVVCATGSEAGFHFVGQHCEYAFLSGNTVEQVKQLSVRAKQIGREYGRAIKTQVLVCMVLGPTEAEAQRLFDAYWDGADGEAIANVYHLLVRDRVLDRAAVMRERHESWHRLFYGGFPFVGGPESTAAMVEDLVVNGEVDGIVFSFQDYFDGLNIFHDRVMPLLRRRGVPLARADALQAREELAG